MFDIEMFNGGMPPQHVIDKVAAKVRRAERMRAAVMAAATRNYDEDGDALGYLMAVLPAQTMFNGKVAEAGHEAMTESLGFDPGAIAQAIMERFPEPPPGVHGIGIDGKTGQPYAMTEEGPKPLDEVGMDIDPETMPSGKTTIEGIDIDGVAEGGEER